MEKSLNPLPEWIDFTQEQKDSLVWGLFDWLSHGDGHHRMWLFQAIYAYFNRMKRPEAT